MTTETDIEKPVRARLAGLLKADFETFEEAPVRHALFRKRRLRVDMIAIPRAPEMSDIALAFEVKAKDDWSKPEWSHVLRQAGDYVLSTLEPEAGPHAGKRVMATFVFPAPEFTFTANPEFVPGISAVESFLAGMSYLASAQRVGIAGFPPKQKGKFTLGFGQTEVWIAGKGWRGDARNVLVGKRQLGSQRFNILDELEGL